MDYLHWRALRSAILAAGLLAAALSTAWAAPKADLWARWTAHDPASMATIDHTSWDRFLGRYLRASPDGINRLAYNEVDEQGRQALNGYIAGLTALPISQYNRPEQFAYWINLYNALTIDTILKHYPVASIMDIDISPGWFTNGPWGRKLARVEGEDLSLDDIEHRILRPVWKDPRIHFAVNCASLGCPNLLPTAFTAENSEAQLEQATRDYVNHPRGARVAGGKLYLSSIFTWYGDDFGDAGATVDFLRRYAEPPLASAIRNIDRFSDGGYDWKLNDAGTAD
jgi:hypothetical protein